MIDAVQLAAKIKAWSESPEGQASLARTAKWIEESRLEQERKDREFAHEWHTKLKHQPMTI